MSIVRSFSFQQFYPKPLEFCSFYKSDLWSIVFDLIPTYSKRKFWGFIKKKCFMKKNVLWKNVNKKLWKHHFNIDCFLIKFRIYKWARNSRGFFFWAVAKFIGKLALNYFYLVWIWRQIVVLKNKHKRSRLKNSVFLD